MREAKKPTELRPIMTRIPERLRKRLAKEAERNFTSMNSEIVRRLEQSLNVSDIVDAVVKEMQRRANAELATRSTQPDYSTEVTDDQVRHLLCAKSFRPETGLR